MRWDIGVDELMARVVSGIDTAPLGAEFEPSAALAGVAARGAAVTVFRVTNAATPTTNTARRTIFQRVVMKILVLLSVRVRMISHAEGRSHPSGWLAKTTQADADLFRSIYNERQLRPVHRVFTNRCQIHWVFKMRCRTIIERNPCGRILPEKIDEVRQH